MRREKESRKGGGGIHPLKLFFRLLRAGRGGEAKTKHKVSKTRTVEDKGLGWSQGNVLTVPSSPCGWRVTPVGRRCLITRLQLNLNSSNSTEAEYFQLKTPSNGVPVHPRQAVVPTLSGQQVLISLPNAV